MSLNTAYLCPYVSLLRRLRQNALHVYRNINLFAHGASHSFLEFSMCSFMEILDLYFPPPNIYNAYFINFNYSEFVFDQRFAATVICILLILGPSFQSGCLHRRLGRPVAAAHAAAFVIQNAEARYSTSPFVVAKQDLEPCFCHVSTIFIPSNGIWRRDVFDHLAMLVGSFGLI